MIPFLDLKKINYGFEPALKEVIDEVVDSGWYLRGEKVKEFEEEFSRFIGVAHTVGCANGLDALTLILKGYVELGVMRPGDEIIVPANTYIASILAITEAGLTPVLVDADADTFQINPSLVERAITPRTKGVMIVHLYGRCAYDYRIGDLCKTYNLKLIEDNAQAVGCKWEDWRTGSLGDAAGHSFYPGKNLGALGDAGAVTTSDPELARIVRTLAFYGSEKKYVFDYCGRNSRIDEIQAAVLSLKLPFLDQDNSIRREIAAIYRNNIVNPVVSIPYLHDAEDSEENVFHIYPILTPYRDRLQKYLRNLDIETIIHYPIPPHRQKCYEGKLRQSGELYVTEKIHKCELSLPISQVMTREEAMTVVNAINSFKLE